MNKKILTIALLICLFGGINTFANTQTDTTEVDIFNKLDIPIYNKNISIDTYEHIDEKESTEWYEYIASSDKTFSDEYIDELHRYAIDNLYCYSSSDNKFYNKHSKDSMKYGDIFFELLNDEVYFIYIPYNNKSTLRNKIIIVKNIGYYLWIDKDTEFEENLFKLTGNKLYLYIDNELRQELKIDE